MTVPIKNNSLIDFVGGVASILKTRVDRAYFLEMSVVGLPVVPTLRTYVKTNGLS